MDFRLWCVCVYLYIETSKFAARTTGGGRDMDKNKLYTLINHNSENLFSETEKMFSSLVLVQAMALL